MGSKGSPLMTTKLPFSKGSSSRRFSGKEQEFLCHIAFSTCLLSGSLAFLNLMAWIGLETESVVFLVLMGLNRLMIGLIGLQGSTRLLIETGMFVEGMRMDE